MQDSIERQCAATKLATPPAATATKVLSVACSALLILLSSAPAAHAQSNPSLQSTQATQAREAAQVGAIIAAEFRKIATSPSQLDRVIATAYGVQLPPDKLEIARRYMRSSLMDENLATYFGGVLAPLAGSNLTQQQLTAAAMEAMASLQIKGLSRLSADRQALFVTHLIGTMLWVSPTDCKALALGQMSTAQSARLERSYIASLPIGRFEAITMLYDEATKAEMRGFPDVRSVNAEQARLAETVYEKAIEDNLRRMMSQEALQRFATSGLEGAPANEACVFVQASTAAMLDMPEPYKTWQLARFTLSMQ